MHELMLLATALFLPLFPLSMVFNVLFAQLGGHTHARILLLLVWPQLGVLLIGMLDTAPPDWVTPLALFTAGLYAFRALDLREVGQWTGFLATSLWSLLWLVHPEAASTTTLHLQALGVSAPLVLLALLTGGLERRFGAAVLGLPGGLAQDLPRYAGVLVAVVLAASAAPLFPAFFILLSLVMDAIAVSPAAAVSLLGIWLLWSWAGARVIQGLVVGPCRPVTAVDLSRAGAWSYALALTILLVGGVWYAGGWL